MTETRALINMGQGAHLPRRSLMRLAAGLPLAALVPGCSSSERSPPVPPALANNVTVLGIPNGRFWGDTQGAALAAEGQAAFERERAAIGENARAGLPPAYFLAVSGGGDDGAFGSGFLCGRRDLVGEE